MSRHGWGMAGVRVSTLVAVAAVLFAGCSQPAEQGGDRRKIQSVSIATGTTAGVYYPVGGAMAEIVNKHVDGVTATAEATGASVENVRLLEQGNSEVAIAQGDVVHQAVHGEGDFDKKVDVRVLMVLYPNVYHNVSLRKIHAKRAFQCTADVKGSRFSVGAPGSGNEVATKAVFGALGMSFKDVKVQRYAYAETARALREGQLDAGSWVVGEGHGTLRELEATDPIHLIPMCDNEVKAVTSKYPYYTPHTIPASTYSTVEAGVQTIALWNVVAVRADFPDELAYQMVKAWYDNVAAINKVYQPGKPYLALESLAHSPAPVHPAVVRYAKEHGVDVPTSVRP